MLVAFYPKDGTPDMSQVDTHWSEMLGCRVPALVWQRHERLPEVTLAQALQGALSHRVLTFERVEVKVPWPESRRSQRADSWYSVWYYREVP